MKDRVQVFLCYANEDQKQAELLYNRLKEEGISVWFDKKELLPGQDSEDAIKKAIRDSQFFIACLSKNAVTKRGFLNREIREALRVWEEQPEGKIYLIPALLEPCDVPDGLRHLQWADVSTEEGIEQLLVALGIGSRETASSELKERANAVYNSYLVCVQVVDRATGSSICNAQVELNIIPVTKASELKEELLLVNADIGEYDTPVVSTSNSEGLAFFGILPHLILGANMRYVISATAPGFGYKHAILKHQSMRFLLRVFFRKAIPAIPLPADEVKSLKADETVKLELSANDFF